MQENMYNTATSIANIFLAAKIYKTLNKHITRKESLIINNDLISLEDYLFEDYNFDNVNTDTLNNLIVIDYAGNILNFANNYYITESELVNFKNGSNMTARIDFKINIHNTKEVTNVVAGVPQVIEISGQATSNDITIKEGDRPSEVNVYDTKSGNLIARIKLVISEKIKPLIQVILERIKKIFANDTLRRSFIYIIGLISSFVIMPVYNKIKSLFKSKQEDISYFEALAEGEFDEYNNINPSETNKINKITNKIIAFISGFFKGVGKILKPFVQFIIALLKGIKTIVLTLLMTIVQLFYTLRGLFIIFLTIVAGVFIGSAGLLNKGMEKIGEAIDAQPIISFAQNLRRVLIALSEKLVTFVIKHGALRGAIGQLRAVYYKAKLTIEQNLEILEDLMNKPSDQIKPKLIRIINNLFDRAIIKTIEHSVLVAIKEASLVRNKFIAADYQRLCDIIINYFYYLSNVLSTKKFINQFMQTDMARDKINKIIEIQIKLIDDTILQLQQYESEIEGYSDVIIQLNRIKQSLINLRIH